MTIRLPSISLQRNSLDQNPQFWVRLVIVVSVLFLSGYLARDASDKYLFVIIGACGGVILLRRPLLGLVALLVSTLVVPFSIGTGSQTPLNITVILIPALLVVWLADMIQHQKIRLVPSSTNLPLFALAISATVSFIAGGLPWNLFAATAPLTAQLGGLAVFIFSAGVFFLVANQVSDQRWLEILTMLFLAIASLYMVGRFGVPFLSSLSTLMNGLGSDGSMFWVWLTALASGQLFFNKKLSRPIQLWLAALIVATLYVGWFLARSWTSGYLPPMVAIGTILWLRSWRLGLVAAVAAILFVLIGNSNLLAALEGLKSYSIVTRDEARDILLQQVFPLSPILGLGPANYYWYTPLIPILGWYVSFNSHNNYVDIIMQTGLVGLACFFWVVGGVGMLGWRLRKHFANDFAQGYLNACLGGLAGTLVSCWLADWLLPFVYNIGLRGFRASVLAWIFMGGLVSLEQIARREDRAH
jgi:hypothetical protein